MARPIPSPGATAPRSRTKASLVALLALVVGIGVGVGPNILRSHGATPPTKFRVDSHRSVSRLQLPGKGHALSATEIQTRLLNSSATSTMVASTPRAAITLFLDALVSTKPRNALDLLSHRDRSKYPTLAIWIQQRQRIIPDVIGYSINEVIERGRKADAVAELMLQPAFDETIGLIPAHATATLRVVREQFDWRIEIGASKVAFHYLSTATINAAAHIWYAAKQHCGSAQQWRTTLYGEGANAIATGLCRSSESPRFSEPATLDGRTDLASFIAAFGPVVGRWARVVRVQSPTAFDLVLAPVDQQWLVIGVLATPQGSGQG